MNKNIKYLWYIIRHKWFVFIECVKLGIIVRGLLHDLSKFRLSEFKIYRDYFYGDDISNKKDYEDIEKSFDKAWLLHQHRNPHHWQYWLLQKDSGDLIVLEMGEKYKKEMLADWIGAGRAINGKSSNVKEWYQKNKDEMIIGEETRKWLEKKINNI